MKHLFFVWAVIIFSSMGAGAQSYRILSVTGDVDVKSNGAWTPAGKRMELTSVQLLKIGKNSAVSILDQKEQKVYSYGKPGETDIKTITGLKTSAIKRFFANFSHTLAARDEAAVRFDANVVYKEIAADHNRDIYVAIMDNNFRSDYPLTLQLINTSTGIEVINHARIGDRFFFRIRNYATEPLFVNVLSIDLSGEWTDCLPAEAGYTAPLLIIPAECTVDLTDYPMELSEPAGNNEFILIGRNCPVDLQQIIAMHQNAGEYSWKPVSKTGIYRKTITIK